MESSANMHTVHQPDADNPRRVADLPGPRAWPLVGNSLQIESLQFHRTLEDWAQQYGSMYKFRAGGRTMVVVSDNALIANLLRDRPEALRRTTRSSRALEEMGTAGLFTAEGEEWRKQRKLVMRGLTPAVIHAFFPTVVAMTERLRLRWTRAVQEGRRVDLLRDLKAYALDVAIGLSMGQDINALEHDDNPLQRDVEQVFYRVARRLTSPFPYWRHFKLPVDRAADACVERIGLAVAGFVAEARKGLAAHPERRTKPTNMLEALIVARDEADSGFTDQHVIGNAVTMVFAGEDTTSNTIAWLLEFVSRHPEAAAKVVAEADAVAAGQSVLQDFAGLERFPYLDAATTEAMRLKPVAPILGMETNREMEIGGVLMPAGTMMLAGLRHSARKAMSIPEPEIFRPERWLHESTGQGGTASSDAGDDPNRKLFPFGGGPRFCPGRYLAMVEVKMVMSMIARNFVLTHDGSAAPVRELFTFTMTPSALPVSLALRT